MGVSLLLIGKDWQARALLRAQLLEEGVEVEAYETVRDALESAASLPCPPQLLVADLSASDNPSAELALLAQCAGQIPTWVLAGHATMTETETTGRGFERVLFRPIHLGELVSQIKERLKSPGGTSGLGA